MRRLGTFCATLLLIVTATAQQVARGADDKPFVHPAFGSDMVLQRGIEDPIWGWTEPGKQVTVSMNGKTATATADGDGKWTAKIGPFEAGGPFELTISGPKEVKLTNILVGDVWICSGQSNMEMGLGNGYDKDHEIASADHPEIRLFTVPKHAAYTPQTGFAIPPENKAGEAKWLVCTPKNIMVGEWLGFSAVGYYFGRDLNEKLHVPIGLIHTSWGGTICEAWTSAPKLKEMSDFKDSVDYIEKNGEAPTVNNRKPGKNDPNVPTVLYNGMIAPLEPMAIKGAIWYQGESNASRAAQYRTLLPTMIKDWRARFTGGEFPFYIVQLASYMKPDFEPKNSQWAELREAQAYAADTVGQSAIAVTLDLGNAQDIHPKNKQEVGARLALDALALTYGKEVEYSGPVYKEMSVEGNKIRLKFDHLGGGLLVGGQGLGGFAIAGEDKKFVWADAKIDHDTVVVSSKSIENPTMVRYGWSNNADLASLFNKAGLPATPFRTDAPK